MGALGWSAHPAAISATETAYQKRDARDEWSGWCHPYRSPTRRGESSKFFIFDLTDRGATRFMACSDPSRKCCTVLQQTAPNGSLGSVPVCPSGETVAFAHIFTADHLHCFPRKASDDSGKEVGHLVTHARGCRSTVKTVRNRTLKTQKEISPEPHGCRDQRSMSRKHSRHVCAPNEP